MKKKIFISMLLAMFMLVLTLGMTGCGGSSDSGDQEEPEVVTLESYYNEHADQKEDVMYNLLGDESEDVTIEAEIKGNDMIQNISYKKTYGEQYYETLSQCFDEHLSELEGAAYPLIEQVALQSGVDENDITINMTYLDGDGTEIWNHVFKTADKTE